MLLQWDWSKATPSRLLHPFVLPLAASLLEAISLPSVVAIALPALREHRPHLLPFFPLPESVSTVALQVGTSVMAVLAVVAGWVRQVADGLWNRPYTTHYTSRSHMHNTSLIYTQT